MSRTISIDPITRLEGHGKIEIFLDDDGAVEDCYFQIPELRGFERFVVGRPIEELPRIVTRICGVCPASHHMASAKAVDGCFGGEVAPLADKLRDMYYNAHYIHSHIAHFYALAAPDFVLRARTPTRPSATSSAWSPRSGSRSAAPVIALARQGAGDPAHHRRARPRSTSGASPAASPRASSRRSSRRSARWSPSCYDFTQFSLQLFRDVVLGNPAYVDLIAQRPVHARRAQHGPGRREQRPELLRRPGARGRLRGQGDLHRYDAEDYADYVAEHVEPWTYLKFPYLKQRGWKGFVEGIDSSHLLRHAAGAAQRGRPHGDAEGAGGVRGDVRDPRRTPQPALLAQHWARLVEMVQNAETLQRYCDDPEITGDAVTASSRSGSPARASASSRRCAAPSRTTTPATRTASARAPTSSSARPTTTPRSRW